MAGKKPVGMKRMVVMIPDAEYEKLEQLARTEMREPGNMLAFLLKRGLDVLITQHAPHKAAPIIDEEPIKPVVPEPFENAIAAVEAARRSRTQS